MNNKERTTSLGTVIALGFIILGILNLFGVLFYKKTSINTTSRIPGILFILTGVVIIIIKMMRKPRE